MEFLGFNLVTLVQTVGYVGLFAIIFAESGLFFGFFFPGDSLLFTAGFLASQQYLSIGWLIVLLIVAAILGDNTGYVFGYKLSRQLFLKEESFFFKKSHVERARRFYEKHGPKAVIIARFLPVVRTFVPILAGVGQMPYPVFVRYNVIGGISWVLLLTLGGYFLGRAIPDVDQYLLPIVLVIIILSVLPTLWQFKKEKGKQL